ncbi:MAG: hypothetical protein V1725_06485 [archaeon]
MMDRLYNRESAWLQELDAASSLYQFNFTDAHKFCSELRHAFEVAFKERCMQDGITVLDEAQSANLYTHALLHAAELTRERYFR